MSTIRPDKTHPAPVLIAGTTASGKSALAVAIAAHVRGVVINADSMQIYTELPILTAQPTTGERAGMPHWLYGHVSARTAYSTGRYLADLTTALADAATQGLRPVIVGGTGLYFKALLEGLSPVPAIPDDIRAAWRRLATQVDSADLWHRLAARDPDMARRLDKNDTQRIVRALEVHEATGRSLAAWWDVKGTPLIDAASAVRFVIDRPRDDIHARCDRRFDLMIDAGALGEVRALLALNLPDDLPAMRALGVVPLAAHCRGKLTLDAAIAQAKLETRQYVKRQQTWLKRNMMSWMTVSSQQMENSERFLASNVGILD